MSLALDTQRRCAARRTFISTLRGAMLLRTGQLPR
jgi:hypothetical protein